MSISVADFPTPQFGAKSYYLARFLLKIAWKWKKLIWLVASCFRFGGGVAAQYRCQSLIGCFMFQVWGRCGRTVQMPQSDWLLHVSGLGEGWTHSTDAAKFGQFGWRCTNKESSYSDNTLVGNWNEKRFDVKEQRKAKPLPSDVSTHAYTHVNTHTLKAYSHLTKVGVKARKDQRIGMHSSRIGTACSLPYRGLCPGGSLSGGDLSRVFVLGVGGALCRGRESLCPGVSVRETPSPPVNRMTDRQV